ncbi:hypothetical protein AVEN_134085-1 [Araneus ventricosus]|uniref:Secreted protein n=1 Tax=Araneus ventricosus TaxID=182803 RepID=A0A4Y2QWI4_ARAVE|nr:hypothetical protein AVEN_134085-1 [Araneus ventricosus]
MVGMVLFQILEHLQLVWVPLASSQNVHGTVLADSHLRRETSSPLCRTPGHLDASTCIDVHSPVAVLGFLNLLASATEPVLSNFMISSGRGGLVVRSRPRDRRVAGSQPDSTEDPPCMGPVAR